MRWYLAFSDTDLVYGKALAQTIGTAVIRMSDAEVLPFVLRNFASTVMTYVDEIKKLVKTMQDDAKERNRQLDEGVFAATADPQELSVPPSRLEVPPVLNLAPLENAANALQNEAEAFDKSLQRATEKGTLTTTQRQEINRVLRSAERELTHRDGLPRRPWFKHLIYAPGFYTGYGVKTLPGVREAIEQRDWKEAESEAVRAAAALEGLARQLRSTRESLQG